MIQTNDIILIIALLTVSAIIITVSIYKSSKRRKEQLMQLKTIYDEALTKGNKQKALIAGRNYYTMTRSNGKLTIYDEQAISNDLNAMKI